MTLATLISKNQLPPKYEKFAIICIDDEEFTLGRSLESRVSIPFLGLSRKHCIFKKYPSGIWSINDQSTFGISVNNNVLPKNADYPIKNGDILKMDRDAIFVYKFNLIESQPTSAAINEGTSSKIHPVLSCSICNELFHKACVIKCGHTYCTHCINEWIAKSKTCPLCRAYVSKITPNVVIDELVQQCVENLNSEEKILRKATIAQRENISLIKNKRNREENDNVIITRQQSKRRRL